MPLPAPPSVNNTRFSAPAPVAQADGTVEAGQFNMFARALKQWAAEVDRFIGGDLTPLTDRLTALEADVEELVALPTDVTALEGRVTVAESAIQVNTDDIAAINLSLAGYVPTSRQLIPSGSVRISGGTDPVDLTSDRTIGVIGSSEGVYGTVQYANATTINSTAASPLYTPSTYRLINALRSSSTYQSTTTQRGAVELATDAETSTGTDTTRAVTPAGLASIAPIAYTPSLTNITVGNGVLEAWYFRLGGWATIYVRFIHGTTSSITGFPTFSTPTGISCPVTGSDSRLFGQSYMVDNSTNLRRIGNAQFNVSNTFRPLWLIEQSGGFSEASVTDTSPWTWASNDTLVVKMDFPLTTP